MTNTNLIYVMRKFDFAASSQVIPLLSHYRSEKTFANIYLLVSSQGFNEKLRHRLDALSRSGIHVSFYRDAPFLHRKLAFLQIRSLKKAISEIVDQHPSDHFIAHARSALVAFLVLKAKQHSERTRSLRLVTDFRGTEWAEYLLFTHLKVPFIREIIDAIETRELLLVEKEVYERSDAVSCVSPDFKHYLEMMWGARSNTWVNPCLAQSETFHYDPEQRLAHREFLSLRTDDIVILFSTGGASPWQNIQPILDSFQRLRVRLDHLADRLKLYVLTPAAAQLAADDAAVKIVSAAPADMNEWLNMADIGVIIRDENIVNRVASPIKVSEYLCAGLPILTNRGVPMAVRWVEETGFGIVVGELADLSEQDLTRLRNLDRKRLSASGTAHYGLDAVAQKYAEIYSSLTQLRETDR